jgi:hypothetical protein
MNRVKESIAADLKTAGYKARQVTVKSNDAGYSTSITITIRDPAVDFSIVEEIERRYIHIDRDERTFEILCGGNTFVDIKVTDEVKEKWSEHYLLLVEAAINDLLDEHIGMRIDDRFVIFKDGPKYFKVHDEYHSWLPQSFYRPADIATDLYILTKGSKAIVTQQAAFRYWRRKVYDDNPVWRDPAGTFHTTAMVIDAAEHFKCASENRDTDIEQKMAGWAVEFATTLKNTA